MKNTSNIQENVKYLCRLYDLLFSVCCDNRLDVSLQIVTLEKIIMSVLAL
jgi:hypothetical protein